MTLTELIAELEKAGNDWDSRRDEAIARAIGWTEEPDGWHAVGVFFADGVLRRTSYAVDVPAFTRSVDDAVALIPPGYVWSCGFSRFVPHEANVRSMSEAHGGWDGHHDHSRAIAICIAALRARSASQQSEPIEGETL